MNEGIPSETILRHVIEENKKLQIEINRLTAEIEWRDKAIAAFKRWQSKVATFKMEYWFNEGIRLMENPPKDIDFKSIRRYIHDRCQFDYHYALAEKYYELAENNYKKMQEAQEEIDKTAKLLNVDVKDLLNSTEQSEI